MNIDYIDINTDEFRTFHSVKSFKAALTFTAIDVKIVFEDNNEVLIQVKAFQAEQ